jgi:hypothetical protein
MNPYEIIASPNWLDQHLGSILEAWTTRDVDGDRCRFCTDHLEAPVEDSSDQFCNEECAAAFETVMDARIALGHRDLEQRGYD